MLPMLLSLEKQFLFVHVPKAAGSSIRNVLAPYCEDPRRYLVNRLLERVGIRVNRVGPFPRQCFRLHDSARTVKTWLPSEVYDRLFKFAVVRNPWDRMVSMYAYISTRTEHHRHRDVVRQQSFDDYLAYELRRRFVTQFDMITDRRGSLIVDFVGRFERLDADFAEVCQRLGIEGRIVHRNQSSHEPYQNYYNERTRKLVGEYFAREIEYFGYQFDAVEDVGRSHAA